MATQSLEYRERTISWDAESGTVEMYMAWKRDFDSCMARIQRTGASPVLVEELEPGYRIVLRSADFISFPMAIKKQREVTEEQRERARQMARAYPLHTAVAKPAA